MSCRRRLTAACRAFIDLAGGYNALEWETTWEDIVPSVCPSPEYRKYYGQGWDTDEARSRGDDWSTLKSLEPVQMMQVTVESATTLIDIPSTTQDGSGRSPMGSPRRTRTQATICGPVVLDITPNQPGKAKVVD